jgi:AraC family transcriptional regulator, activator of mtrCDE
MPPIPHLAPADLDKLMSGLEVEFVKLAECLVSPGWRLALAATDVPGVHYTLSGMGRMIIGDCPPIPLMPHTLVIIPPSRAFRLEARAENEVYGQFGTVESRSFQFAPGELRRVVAGERAPQIVLICGYFKASYAAAIEPFSTLTAPIVEEFEAADQVDATLRAAMAELIAQEVGAGAMSTTLLKQVLITILRRSLVSADRWAERFAALSDPRIARAFSDMLARPSAPHTVQTLAHTAGLSRSSFMSRFTQAFGDSPMTVLRQLRMRRARMLLATNSLTIDQVAGAVGYASRSSFHRAFRKFFGADAQPTE